MSEIALRFELESSHTAPRLAREAVRPLEGEIGSEALSDLALVLSELTTNAVTFGPGFDIHVLGRGRRATATSAARSTTAAFAGVAIRRRAIRSRPSGLGLMIVDALTSGWGVEPETTRVWFELPPDGRLPAHDARADRRTRRAAPA